MPSSSDRHKRLGTRVVERVKATCAVRNIMEIELLGNAGISRAAWNRMRYGSQSLSTMNLVRICKVLDVNSDYLLGLSDDMQRLD